MSEPVYEPIEVAIALALYGYNVSAPDRAMALYDHFCGGCPDLERLHYYLTHYGHAATSLPFPSAEVYVRHALERYGEEARRRVRIERAAFPGLSSGLKLDDDSRAGTLLDTVTEADIDFVEGRE